MSMTYATITGRITKHGSDEPVVGTVCFVPRTASGGLRIEGERLTIGTIVCPISETGYILDPHTNTPGVKIPLTGISGLVWRISVQPKGFYAEPWELGSYEIAGDADLNSDTFDPVELTGLPSSETLASFVARAEALSSSFVTFGASDPSPFLPDGTEYVWFKTDGAGTLLDIVSGVA